MEPLDEEFLHVARDLCAVAAALLMTGAVAAASCQLEQATDLLEERARIVSARPVRKEAELQ